MNKEKAEGCEERLSTRSSILAAKGHLKEQAALLSQDAKTKQAGSPERNRIYKAVQENIEQQDRLEELLREGFVPQHSQNQLISPRAFFVSPLFRVCSKKVARSRDTLLEFKNNQGKVLFTYNGPELRQSDGLVFMALLNLARDLRAGDSVSFTAEELCMAVFKRYDGPARSQLRDHIKRLQRGLIEFDKVSVQLCLRFEFPSKGPWSVALDKDIVRLFQQSPQVWLDFQKRRELPEGLSTWLYSFIESQSKLIPTKVSTLRELCGSDANEESFVRTLRIALKELSSSSVLEEGWRITGGLIHWMKRRQATEQRQASLDPPEGVC